MERYEVHDASSFSRSPGFQNQRFIELNADASTAHTPRRLEAEAPSPEPKSITTDEEDRLLMVGRDMMKNQRNIDRE